MTIGMGRARAFRLRGMLAVVLCGAASCAGVIMDHGRARADTEPSGRAWALADLMRVLSRVTQRDVIFEETHHSNILKVPLKTKGRLSFTAPSTVAKTVLEPFEERYVADGPVLTVTKEAEQTERTIALDEHPALRAFVEGFRSVLAGDGETLLRFYDARVEGSREGWTLTLRPREAGMREQVRALTFTGEGPAIHSVRIARGNGEYSEMLITRPGQ